MHRIFYVKGHTSRVFLFILMLLTLFRKKLFCSRILFLSRSSEVPLIKQPVVSAITQAVNGKTKFFAKCQFETMPNKFVKGAKAVYKVDWLVNDKVVRTETLSGGSKVCPSRRQHPWIQSRDNSKS